MLQMRRSGGELIRTARFKEESGGSGCGLLKVSTVPKFDLNPPELRGDVAVEGDLDAKLLHPLSLLSSNPFGINSLLKRDLRVDKIGKGVWVRKTHVQA